MIKTPEQAVAAATCALARISTFKSQGRHDGGCPMCDQDPRELCRMVAVFMDDTANAAAIRLYETEQGQRTMESMWLE
jgi:hypothetical protein